MSRVEELERLITKYASSYYTGESEVSDEYFDNLVSELRSLNPESEVLSSVGWGYDPKSKVSHMYGVKVLGLPKIHEVNSIPSSIVNGFYVSPKLDGLSVVCYYKNGELVKSVTRGNGTEGKDVTIKLVKIEPNCKSMFNNFTGAIRGEVIITNEDWSKMISSGKYDDNDSANQRNIAAGILNRDYIDDDIKYLSYVTYKVLASDVPVSGVVANDEMLSINKLNCVSRKFVCNYNTPDYIYNELKRSYDEWSEIYPEDGVVLTSPTFKSSTDRVHVLSQDEVAYKFPSERKTVTVTDVTWRATRTGKLQPRVWFTPVKLSGAQVQKCTGFNAAFIRDNKINVGTDIEVTRSGEVIPHLVRVVNNTNTEGLLPTECPRCGNTDLEWKGDDLVCNNENESQVVYRYITVTSPVDNCGWSMYSKFISALEIDNINDLVHLIGSCSDSNYKDELVSKLTNSLSGSVTKSKAVSILNKLVGTVEPVHFLVGCNISGISWTSADTLLSNYPEFISDSKTHSVDWTKVSKVPGFGYKTVVSLQKFEDRISKLAVVANISDYVNEGNVTNHQFNVAITGSLSIKRSDFESKLNSIGVFTSSNFKDIKYLITNNPDSTSSKMKKAISNGVEVISEEEFSKRYFNEN